MRVITPSGRGREGRKGMEVETAETPSSEGPMARTDCEEGRQEGGRCKRERRDYKKHMIIRKTENLKEELGRLEEEKEGEHFELSQFKRKTNWLFSTL